MDLVAAPVAIVLQSQMLTEDLKASRERVIDSIGLAARHRPERAESLATELAEQLRQSVEAVRRLAYGLSPAALDELGLVGALREEGDRLGPVRVIVEAPESLPTLPSSVEVAAYRITAEALTNVVRHSDAKLASVQLTTDSDSLKMIISDDGNYSGPGLQGSV